LDQSLVRQQQTTPRSKEKRTKASLATKAAKYTMGIPNFLPELEKTAGRLIDLREYPGRKIAIDVSVWIQRECHAQGDMLADEQHLSNFGRANLLLLQEEQQREEKEQPLAMQQTQQQQGSHDGDNDQQRDVDNASHHNKSQMASKEEIIQRYVQKVSHAVIDDLIRFRDATKSQVLVVFDGATPPVKYRTVETRKRKRDGEIDERDRPVDATTTTTDDGEYHNIHVERRYRANRRAGAGDHYGTVVDTIIHLLRQQQELAFLVAPYEADGQLAYLQLHGHVDLVVTNDSDLLAYGPLSPVLYKIARDEQRNWTRGILLRRGDLGAILPGGIKNNDHQYSMLDWSPALLTVFFVSCGGDYCRKLTGIGVKTVAALVRELFLTTTKVKTTKHGAAKDYDDEDRDDDDETEQLQHPLGRLIQRLLTMTWENKTITLAEKFQYEMDFLAAVFTYRHSIVYDPLQAKCCHLFPLDDHTTPDVELVDYRPYRDLLLSHTDEARQRRREIIGPMLPPDLATYIAEGWICPKRMALRPIPATTTATTTTSDVPPPGVVAALQAYHNNNSGSPLRRQDGGNDDDETTMMVVADGATTTTATTTNAATTGMTALHHDHRDDTHHDNDEAVGGSSCGDEVMEPAGTQLMDDDVQQPPPEEPEEIIIDAGGDSNDDEDDDDNNVMETQEH
jgi:5'-3' exonuclease